MIKFKDILKESEDLDTLINRKLLNIVAKSFDLNFKYNDWNSPILDQMRQKGIFNFMDQTLVLNYDKITVTVPSSTIQQETYLTIVPQSTPNSKHNLKQIGKIYQIGTADIELNQMVQIEFQYNESTLSDLDESNLAVYQKEAQSWKKLNSTVDAQNNSIKIVTPKLGTFGIFIDDKSSVAEATVDGFLVNQNYPNPFNSSTQISYQLANDSNIRVNIYNLKGELVKSLFEGFQQQGFHNIEWNGDSQSNLSVTSGIYFCRISTKQFTSNQKMILLK